MKQVDFFFKKHIDFYHKIGKNIALTGNDLGCRLLTPLPQRWATLPVSLDLTASGLLFVGLLSSFGRSVGRQLLAAPPSDIPVRFRTQALHFFWCISKLIDCIMTMMTSLTFTKRGSFSDSPILTNILYSFQVIIRCHYFRYVKGARALHKG